MSSADSTGTPSTTVPWARYVAVGDSFTEGLWDHPGGVTTDVPGERLRGWADRLATSLSARREAAGAPPLEYANLAVRGRLARPIVREQLPVALAAEPDLVSIVAGGNDILRPRVDVDAVCAVLESAVAQIRATGADVLVATGFDPTGTPLVELTRPRVARLSANVWSIARRHGAHVLDLWGMRCLHDHRVWAQDRIHLLPEGHRRVAQAALVALGLTPDDDAWDDPLPTVPRDPWRARAREDARWARVHLLPWATRRLRARSSGDDHRPKDGSPRPAPPAS